MKAKHSSLISPKGRRLLVIMLFLLPFGKVGMGYAQTPYVAIPDSNFVHYLKTIVPTAFKGDSLNTSSSLVTTTTHTLQVPINSIANLDGIQYFSSLTYLDCSQNPNPGGPTPNTFTVIPTLPPTLLYFDCSGNYSNLKSIPVLPNSLQTFFCGFDGQITSLPILPNSLTWLACASSNINCFPTFPNSITSINIDPNPYTCLPNYITAMNSTDLAKPLCTTGCAAAGIEQVTGINAQIAVYPNPARDVINVKGLADEECHIQVMDMFGNFVMEISASGKTNVIDVNSLSQGIYNVSITNKEGTINKKLVLVD